MVDGGIPLGASRSPLLFFSHASKALVTYAEGLEIDGHFGDQTKAAWRNAINAWERYTHRELDTPSHSRIRLADKERYEEITREMAKELESMEPGLRAKIAAEKKAALTPEQRAALDMLPSQRTQEQAELATRASELTYVRHKDVADRISDPDQQEHAKALAKRANDAEEVADNIHRQREIVNYDYWNAHTDAGPTDDWQAAQKLLFQAKERQAETDWDAQELYEQGFAKWKDVLEAFPILKDNPITADDLSVHVEQYRNVLGQDKKAFPENFVLNGVVDLQSIMSQDQLEKVNPRRRERFEETTLGKEFAPQAGPAGEGTAAASAEPAGEGTAVDMGESPAGEGTDMGESPAGEATDMGESPAGEGTAVEMGESPTGEGAVSETESAAPAGEGSAEPTVDVPTEASTAMPEANASPPVGAGTAEIESSPPAGEGTATAEPAPTATPAAEVPAESPAPPEAAAPPAGEGTAGGA